LAEEQPKNNGGAQGSSGSGAIGEATRSVTTLRETSKWLLTILGGVGAVLAAGVQLSNAGQLDPGWRLWLALAAALATLLFLGLAIRRVVQVLTSGASTLDDLVEEEKGQERGPKEDIRRAKETGFLVDPYQDVEEFRDAYRDAKRQLSEEEQKKPRDAAKVARLRDRVKLLGKQAMPQLFAGVRYYRVRRLFDEAVGALLCWGFLAALGILAFAWATNPAPEPSDPSPFRTPVEGSVSLTPDGRDSLSDALGEQCVQEPVRVIALSASEQTAEVVSIPTAACDLRRFTITYGENGDLQPAGSVSIPSGVQGD
jgi:hypothetical protein